ncbi:MAG: 7-cyano-7-deazaguanine synthase QueC [Porphyromonas sp.]|uniref:7-cyano-7-deazaguanine synthase QueC n=1 Tax=Porphyromonas sp. TaxID=1924944 RepID=UPI001A3ADAEE|nr:7-cyano-7-deazaguanine synthase QueC [Porphyromonas sp.]MBL6453025.1 7-cyano-7-deazaguanine synthase QueC [Porphyromonas sp.]
MRNSLIALSGGVDSTTLLYEYREEIACAVGFDYGSKHNARELAAADAICRELEIPYLIIPLAFIGEYFRSDLLLSGGEMLLGDYSEENMSSTVVPFRNGIMLSILAGLAESRDLQQVLIANHFGDHAIYPDCRESFVKPMGEAITAGTSNGVKLVAPYTTLTKAEIVARGTRLGVPYGKTYSCYQGGERHCGRCGTCRERHDAFVANGLEDPTLYEE